MDTRTLSAEEVGLLLGKQEGHFLDMKSKQVQPAKLTRTLSAFANADGGEVFIGIDQTDTGWKWNGFTDEEGANGFLQIFEELFPLSADFQYTFLAAEGENGLVLHVQVLKTRDVRNASDGVPYLRRGAQNLPQRTPEQLTLLRRTKGIVSFEDETLPAKLDVVANSNVVIEFLLSVVPNAEPEVWLRKQQVIADEKPTVAGALLFAEEPQVYLPKGAVKIYRYKTTAAEGTRETLAFNPITIEGCIYRQIADAVQKTVALAEQIPILGTHGLETIRYPRDSLHEIITNAVLHRDYALNDDVHVRIFDDRVEVESPGRLPAHITPDNILTERFARNPKIVRLINKFPEPPNKDVGEGLNTAFLAMKQLGLRDPEIRERENSVLVFIRHERLASPESVIMDYVRQHGSVQNSVARKLTGIQSEIEMRRLLKKLVNSGELEQIPNTFKGTSAYRIPVREPAPE